MANEDTQTTTSKSPAPTTKPEEEKNSVARKINAWGFITLLVLVFLVFGPIAAILSWRSNSLEGANILLKIVFAVLAYFGNFVYILWFAFKKTIVPVFHDNQDDNTMSMGSPFAAATVPAAPANAPAPSPASSADALDDDMFAAKPAPVASPAPVAPLPPQQGGKKKLKARRRRM